MYPLFWVLCLPLTSACVRTSSPVATKKRRVSCRAVDRAYGSAVFAVTTVVTTDSTATAACAHRLRVPLQALALASQRGCKSREFDSPATLHVVDEPVPCCHHCWDKGQGSTRGQHERREVGLGGVRRVQALHGSRNDAPSAVIGAFPPALPAGAGTLAPPACAEAAPAGAAAAS
jgi:hypothetical protein